MSIVWLNGELLPEDRALVPALDRGVLWGYGLFETMRAYGGRLWAFDDHYDRLRTGAEVIDISSPDPTTLSEVFRDVLRANELEDAGVRVTITAGTGPADPQSDPTGAPAVLVTAWPLRDYSNLYADGAVLATIPGGGRPLAGLKTTSYVVSVAGRVIARRAGADDALFVASDGRVLEATGSNLFAARGDELVTPPLTEAVLPGVTRRHVLAVAGRIGFGTVEESLTLDDLFAVDEVVLTSSLREVYPARSIDGRELKRCGVAEKLRDVYHAAVLESL
jgi:branched-subunit amino acid aminotransferase/4-amino-4-deoxychorismate lyase